MIFGRYKNLTLNFIPVYGLKCEEKCHTCTYENFRTVIQLLILRTGFNISMIGWSSSIAFRMYNNLKIVKKYADTTIGNQANNIYMCARTK